MSDVFLNIGLENILREIKKDNPDNKLVSKLLKMKTVDVDHQWERLDVSPTQLNDIVQVTMVPNSRYVMKKSKFDRYLTKERLSKKHSIKIGKFINRFIDVDAPELEEFVNLYKSKYDESKDKSTFIIVDGEEIRYWYLCYNYQSTRGQLGKSCMRHDTNQHLLDMYINSPDKIKMLILVDSMGKLLGRCLLWKLDYPDGKIYADRIYTNKDSDIKRFTSYINKRKWMTHTESPWGGHQMVSVINNYDSQSPWLDTFKVFKKPPSKVPRPGNRISDYEADGIMSDILGEEKPKEDDLDDKVIMVNKAFVNSSDATPYKLIGKSPKEKNPFKRYFTKKDEPHTFESLMNFKDFRNMI